MTRISALTPATAQGAAKDMLSELVARHGQVGSMVSTMAHSPAVLGGYLQLSKAMKRAKLSRRISEVISIAVQARQGCQLCLDAHIAAARTFGVTDAEIAAACEGTSPDPAISAMITLGLAIYSTPTTITNDQVAKLRAFGYTDREIVDAVGIVALNVLTGAFNLVAGLEPDPPRPDPPRALSGSDSS
ncbi:hypothetical protein NPS01_40080 [Nocardioides psychrotolerans]|uniref:Alkylhydroperoxidase AhpD family core domain-containing protein n=1 Tax=Nocardioides psychrotolerans TaxID=1005945 RepID=A0A1I3RAY9_9ACTN|nr:carboxymuconolactone decarboxylase family protein [Nocardioides psychrotolerans]GEP40345.1 hypothetical protein NPS01_40080 [Nocardioides psychrotolerans]SFJ42531.1 alkylhydroperoxidase AhpD family core domain-containing protein [Nocardioides psychrotolerans]